MGPSFKSLIKYLFFSFFSLFLLSSCVQNSTELAGIDFKIFYTFNNKASTPEASVTLYAQTNSDPRLLKEVQIVSKEDDYIWNLTDFHKVLIEGEKFIVCNNIVVPEGKEFSTGTYSMTFKTYTDDETTLDYTFLFNNEIYKKKCSEIEAYITNEVIKNIVIYDNNNSIIYYGLISDYNNTKELISANYKDAAYYNEVWILQGGKEILIFPEDRIIRISEENKD